jgi:hypothetical protein
LPRKKNIHWWGRAKRISLPGAKRDANRSAPFAAAIDPNQYPRPKIAGWGNGVRYLKPEVVSTLVVQAEAQPPPQKAK